MKLKTLYKYMKCTRRHKAGTCYYECFSKFK